MSNVMTLPKNPYCPLGAVIIQLPVRNWWPQSQEIQATSRMRGHSFAKHSSPTIPIRMMKLYVYVGYETTVYCVLISELMIKDFRIFEKLFHAHNNYYNNNNNINCIAFKCLKNAWSACGWLKTFGVWHKFNYCLCDMTPAAPDVMSQLGTLYFCLQHTIFFFPRLYLVFHSRNHREIACE